MYCVKCGSKLEENAKFCPNCGMAVKNTKISKPNKEGSIRKEIKKEARMKNKTPLVLAALSAEGETTITDIKHLLRGYSDLIKKLTNVGAKIWLEDE